MKPLPVAIPPWCTTALQLVLAVSALGRGVDYINDSRPQPGLSVVEAFLPLDTWGIFFTVLGLLMLMRHIDPSSWASAPGGGRDGRTFILDADRVEHRAESPRPTPRTMPPPRLIWGAAASHAILAVSLMLAARMRR